MSWHKLNNYELQAVRKMLLLDVREAAELIGGVSVRTWQYWESGRNKVPEDVDTEMYALISQRNEVISKIIDADESENQVRWYHSFKAFEQDYPGQNHVWWKLYQSVAAYLFSEAGDIELDDNAALNKDSALYKYFSRTRTIDIGYREQEKKLSERISG